MTAYIYKGKGHTGGYLLVIKFNGKVISERIYSTLSSAKDDAKDCIAGNY
jgi:hypothetical protein